MSEPTSTLPSGVGGDRGDLTPSDPKHPYWDADHPDHRAAVDAVSRKYRAAETGPVSISSRIAADREAAETAPARRAASLPPQQAAAEVRIAELTKSDAYNNAEHPGHRAAVAEVSKLYAVLYPSDDNERGDLPHVSDLRAWVGVEGPPEMPSQFAERWDIDRESEFLAWCADERLPGVVVSDLMEWYVRQAVLDGGYGGPAEAEFREFAKGKGLSSTQTEELVRWARAVHGEAAVPGATTSAEETTTRAATTTSAETSDDEEDE